MNRIDPDLSSTARCLRRLSGLVLAAMLACAGLAAPAAAQESGLLPELPGITSYAPANRVEPLGSAVAGELLLEARLTPDGDPVPEGLVWRVFGDAPQPDGTLPLIASASGGAARFQLEPGSYLIHAAFGRAGASARVTLGTESRREVLVMNAGGLKLEAMLPDGSEVRRPLLGFDIYEGEAAGERALILPDVPPGATVRLHAGTYHVVSKYGDVNAKIRADLRVEAGKVTEATIEHRAARVTLNLVRTENGFPLADTAWTVIGTSGEVLAEDVGAYPTMILASGEYTVIAKHRGQIFQQEFSVDAGRDVTVRVLASGIPG